MRKLAKSLLQVLFLYAIISVQPSAAETLRVATTFRRTNIEFPNPERGFWRFVTANFTIATADELRNIRAAGLTMGYAVVRLDAFRGRALPQTTLTRLATSFGFARASGVKLILRFAYNYPNTEDPRTAKDAPLSIVLGHIRQLAPVIAATPT
jgi:hypothetical protein